MAVSPMTGAASFNHFVGANQERWGHGDAESTGSLEVDDKLEFRRDLD
jgi:hypothetical protein